MNSRTLFAQTMSHKKSDTVPIDIGATTLTSMSKNCEAALCDFLGFKHQPKQDNNRTDERILQWAGTDFRAVGNIVELPSKHSRKISETEYVDCWGIQQKLVDHQWQIVNSPLRNATREDIKSYPWPKPVIDEKLMAKWLQQARKLKEENKYVVIAEHPYYGILELGMWLCGYDSFLMNLALNTDLVKTFFEIITNLQLKVAEQYYSELGPYIDLTTSGDDFGTQRAPMMSPKMFEELISPFFTERIARTKELGQCYYWHHSCGSVYDLLDSLIKCGVDILNPVQLSADNMEPEKLKATFGDKIVFWGGVDVQQFLPNAKPQQVKEHVDYLIKTLGKDGGYVIAGAHNMQDDIPPENIAALVEAARGNSNRTW